MLTAQRAKELSFKLLVEEKIQEAIQSGNTQVTIELQEIPVTQWIVGELQGRGFYLTSSAGAVPGSTELSISWIKNIEAEKEEKQRQLALKKVRQESSISLTVDSIGKKFSTNESLIISVIERRRGNLDLFLVKHTKDSSASFYNVNSLGYFYDEISLEYKKNHPKSLKEAISTVAVDYGKVSLEDDGTVKIDPLNDEMDTLTFQEILSSLIETYPSKHFYIQNVNGTPTLKHKDSTGSFFGRS